jgi:hypothetical protein
VALPRPLNPQVGLCFVAYALIVAAVLLPEARRAASPVLYVCIIGGIFVGVPAALGVGIVATYLRSPKQRHEEQLSIVDKMTAVVPDTIWWVLGAVSGFLAGRVGGRSIFKLSLFQHTTVASITAVCLIAAFLVFRKKLPQLSGWCLWLGAFAIGLLTVR